MVKVMECGVMPYGQGKFRVRVRIRGRVWVRVVNTFWVRVITTQNLNPDP